MHGTGLALIFEEAMIVYVFVIRLHDNDSYLVLWAGLKCFIACGTNCLTTPDLFLNFVFEDARLGL